MDNELKKIGVEVGIGAATVATAVVLGPVAAVALLAAGGAALWKACDDATKPASGSQSTR